MATYSRCTSMATRGAWRARKPYEARCEASSSACSIGTFVESCLRIECSGARMEERSLAAACW
jgi:hypothetical protein